MTLRQVGAASQEERIGANIYSPCSYLLPTVSGNVEHGLARGKEAVGLDTSDGTSWSLLGNAYLSHFFQVLVNLFVRFKTIISRCPKIRRL